jgi:AcrR family transcriptional regulator
MTAPASSLRDTLIDAGCALLTEGGAEALTLRRCAARAGVSHAAPAHHFDGLPGLLNAIAERGHTKAGAAMEAEAALAQDPRARLHAIGRGYLTFARDNGALFALMFRKKVAMAPESALHAASSRAYGMLKDACAPFVPPGIAPEVIEAQTWSLIHGCAFLLVSGQIGGAAHAPCGVAAAEDVMTLLDRIGVQAEAPKRPGAVGF